MGVRFSKVILAAALLGAGLLAASPFLCRRLVGTGEAFNYSLSVADAVLQMRHGILPPLAGQTEFAYNGRIHPLRNAPYLYYLAGVIDAGTLHRLKFWELQNASLVLSMVAAVFACYIGLRWATACPRFLAFFLAATYGLSPALLCAAHSLNLLMTVHAAAFVPLAVAACVRGCRQPSMSADALMAAALALAWLAHPPVALWLTFGVILARVISFAGRPGWLPLARAGAAAILCILLAGFGFASVATLKTDLNYFSQDHELWRNFADVTIQANLRLAMPGSLFPVSRTGNSYTDLQFGYVAWGLLALSLTMLFRRPRDQSNWDRPSRVATAGVLSVVLLLLLLTLPVPWVTRWLWVHMPGPVLEMTSAWPMQRLYLVALGFTVFGAALALPARWRELNFRRWVPPLLLGLGMAWTFYEAKPIIERGFANRHTLAGTEAVYRPSNLDLTGTSYAFFGPSPTFINGVADPRFEYRLLKNGLEDVASNYASALAKAPVVQRGSISVSARAHDSATGSQTITLLPGHRYLITFAFRTAPFHGSIEFVGPLLRRAYSLPEGGYPNGFGMLDGERRALSISTDSDKPEPVTVTIGVADGTPFAGHRVVLADFALQDVDMNSLPVRLDGYLPMRLVVNSPQAGCALETPQRYISGYEATIDGRHVPVRISPWRNVMVGVPPGRSVVEIRYVGAPLARTAFWVSSACWAGFIIWMLTGCQAPERIRRRAGAAFAASPGFVGRHKLLIAAATAVVAAAIFSAVRRAREQAILDAVGPIEIRFMLPYGKVGYTQPLFATGRPSAGVIISVAMLDERRIRLNADVWGTLYRSEPIDLDYSKVHTLVVSDSALFPADHPRVQTLTANERQRLRTELRVDLDGSAAIDVTCYAFEAARSEIYVGRTPFGSTSTARFDGIIVDSRRLPIPRLVGMPWGGRARLNLRFPSDRVGTTESLLTFNSGTETILYSVTYIATKRLRFTSMASDGAILQSADVDADLTKPHTISFWPSEPSDRKAAFSLSVDFDGRHVMGGTKPLVTLACPIISTGVNYTAPQGSQVPFSGPELSLILTAGGTSTGSIEEFGPAHLIVTLPSKKTGRHEPILTTGRNGAGDIIYIYYEDDQHVRFGFDHWGAGGDLSPSIAVDYRMPHDIWVVSGSLYPTVTDDASWGAVDPKIRARLKSLVVVVIDGKTVISEKSATFPSSREEVTFARNRIAASTADPDFSGVLHYSERTGTVLPPGFKL